METKEETRVVFKMTEDEPIAFLFDVETNIGNIMSYMTVGQHGEASIDFARKCRLANEKEYSGLKKELESIGYSLYLRKKIPARFTKGIINHKA